MQITCTGSFFLLERLLLLFFVIQAYFDTVTLAYGDRLAVPSSSSSRHAGADVDGSSESNFEESETSAFESDTDSAVSSSDVRVFHSVMALFGHSGFRSRS